MKRVIIQGSSRSDGNTNKIVRLLMEELECELVDLNKLEIGRFDYEFRNKEDDFLPLIRKLVDFDLLIFATPVYWYSMSGLMKDFFDRITDCLKLEKDTGRKLRGKYMAAFSVGSDDNETEGFFHPFNYSAEYLGMNYLGDVHTWIEEREPIDLVRRRIVEFADQLRQNH